MSYLHIRREKRKELISQIEHFFRNHPSLKSEAHEIKAVLDLYTVWRHTYLTTRYSVFKLRFAHVVLYSIAERMFWSNFDQSQEVVTLLDCIYEADKNFSSILHPEMFALVENGRKLDFVCYFLDHTTRLRATFKGRRMVTGDSVSPFDINTPWIVPDPSLFHTLLRYGALLGMYSTLMYEDKILRLYRADRDWTVELDCLRSTVRSIVTFNPSLLGYNTLRAMVTPEEAGFYLKSVSCCDLLLKDLPQIHTSFLVEAQFEARCTGVANPVAFARKFSENVLSDFGKHFLTPLDLKHGCRLVIRKILHDKWLLPKSIYELPLAEPLQKYLDLY